jgi:aldehyde dehydrogenase (NAD+)
VRNINAHFIDGEFAKPHGCEFIRSVNPANRQVIGNVALADETDARRAVAAARRAFATFSRSARQERIAILRRMHRVTAGRADRLIAAMVEECGGTLQFSSLVVKSAVEAFRRAEIALSQIEPVQKRGTTTLYYEPVGVAALITPWNAQALFLCAKIASAIAAGCTVVAKPSELSALQTQTLLECLQEADLPPGVLNVVTGRGELVGAELVRNPDVAKIAFTGSAAAGQSVLRDGVATRKRVTLELRGKCTNIVLDEAELATAIPDALAIAFSNRGQACVAGTRLLAPIRQLDAVKTAIVAALPAFRVGQPADPGTAVGPMVTQKQFERVQAYIRIGIAEGAEVLAGGEGHPEGLERGFFVKPTVFVDVKNEMTIAQQEIWGPVLCVIGYEDEGQAIRIANDTRHGLHGFVSGTNLTRAHRVASKMHADRVAVNETGVGREFGTLGIEPFLEACAILE